MRTALFILALAIFGWLASNEGATAQNPRANAAAPPASAPPQSELPVGSVPRAELPTARAFDYDVDDVQISTILGWLRRFSVEPPVALTGRVSGWLWAQSPARGWWRLGDYRVEAELTSELLGIDRFAIRDARIRLGYQDGLWTVGQATGQIESLAEGSDQPRLLGQANLTAQLPMSTTAVARASGTLQGVSLIELLGTFGLTENIPSGTARGNFQLETTLATLSQPLRWNASGALSATQVRFGQLPVADVQTNWHLADERLSLTDMRAALAGQTVQLAANVDLTDAFQWDVQLPQQPLVLSRELYTTLQVPVTDSIPLGSVQLSANSSGTLNPWRAEYGFQLGAQQLLWFQNNLADLSVAAAMTSRGIRLDSLSTRIAGGLVTGQAEFLNEPAAPLRVNLNYQDLDLAQLRAPVELPAAVGIVSGTGSATVDTTQITSFNALALDVQGSGRGVRVSDWGFGNIKYAVRKTAGNQALDISVEDAGAARRWQASGDLVSVEGGNWSYDIAGTANRLDLSWRQLFAMTGMEWQLPVPLQTVLATGKIALRGETGVGLRETQFDFDNLTAIQTNRAHWAVGTLVGRTTPTAVIIEKGDFDIAASKLTWAMEYHWDGVGEDRLQFDLKDFSLETLGAWGLSSLPFLANPKSVLGATDVTVDVHRASGQPTFVAGWAGALGFDVRDLVVRGQEVGNLSASGQLAEDQWDTQVRGEIFSAPLSGELLVTLQREPNWSVAGVHGQLAWLGAEANRLIGLWQPKNHAVQWRGTTYVRAQVDWQASGEQTGFFEVTVPQLAYQGRPVARDVRAGVQLENDVVRITRFDGSVGGGTVRVDGAYDLAAKRAQGLVVNLERISLEEAMRLYDPRSAADVRGRADLRLSVHMTRSADLHGNLRINDAVLSGLPISEAHSDFQLTASPDFSLVRVQATNIRGRAFGGRLDAEVRARINAGNNLQLRARIQRGEVEQLSKWTGTSSVVGRGKFNADVTLTAPRFRSLRDLQGRLDVVFEDTDARTLPVADQLARFVPLFGLPSTEFERGRMMAFISRGDLRVRSLALWGSQMSVMGAGSVGLVSRRLDLELVARVGGGLSQQVAANYLSQLAATAVPPVELLLQINRLVANRAIFLHVGGSTTQPVIQPQTGRIIEQTLIRSLLEQAAPIVGAVSQVGQTAGIPR